MCFAVIPDILEMYLQASPNVSPRTKNELKRVVENLKQSTIQQQQSQIQQLMQKLTEAAEYIKALDGKSKYLQEYVKNLQNEFTGKINNANKIINGLYKDLENTKTEGQKKSENAVAQEVQA